MQNLVLCYNSQCDKHPTCVRFSEPRTEWASFHDFQPEEGGRCEAYIPREEDNSQSTQKA